MPVKSYNVLFLCTGNSARSIMAESLLRHWDSGRFHAYSAGSHPTGTVSPLAIEILKRRGLPTCGLRSKSWDEFAQAGAPQMDFIFTVCDQAKGEVCPVWPGQPVTAHWGVEDPAAVPESELERLVVFRRVLQELENRIKIFVSLRIGALDWMTLKKRLDAIGRSSF